MAPTTRNSYRGVLLVLVGASLLGAAGALAGGLALGNSVLLDAAVTLGISTGVLLGATSLELTAGAGRISRWFRDFGGTRTTAVSVGAAGIVATSLVLLINVPVASPDAWLAGTAAAFCLAAAGLAAIAARYLADIEPARFPEGPALSQGARVVTWVLVLGAVSMFLIWAAQDTVVRVVHSTVVIVNVLVCCELLLHGRLARRSSNEPFPPELVVLSILGNRPNTIASVLDCAERQLGIDLRSTWALTVVRRSLEPLVFGLCLAGWLSTSLTVVGTAEQGLVERLGVPLAAAPLLPGLHLHWPWPVDQVSRIPVRRVQTLTVGHEGEARTGPEDVLWTVEHVPKEYTLLVGDGRDLITVDAAVQYRVRDPWAWRYHCQNPADALRAIAYRAVMRATANRTLSQTLSENVAMLTGGMRATVQQEAEALGLGVEIVGFTVRGMHPPVRVADAYEAVVSAELGMVTAVVNARALRNQIVPAAEASAFARESTARAEGANAVARAAGEAWSFRTVESQYRAAGHEYLFRRRLETMEAGLAGRRFTVVDSRFQRDGGELWLPQ